ncbi:MAG: hypothetical protein E6R03_12810 [Hyphomicrobiaceae bacterium]|nr:MAG: hypothetical protein E6R03_12810 [Hyphomicrobiaceae bacterium]
MTARDLIGCGFCARGQKSWFDLNGIDFRSFLENGVSAERLLATGDGLAIKAVEMLRQRRGV